VGAAQIQGAYCVHGTHLPDKGWLQPDVRTSFACPIFQSRSLDTHSRWRWALTTKVVALVPSALFPFSLLALPHTHSLPLLALSHYCNMLFVSTLLYAVSLTILALHLTDSDLGIAWDSELEGTHSVEAMEVARYGVPMSLIVACRGQWSHSSL
jgi:hypothetical protein